MLVLTRKVNQGIRIGDDIEVVVLEVRGEQVRLGIRAPRNVAVHRDEVYDKVEKQNIASSDTDPVDVPEDPA